MYTVCVCVCVCVIVIETLLCELLWSTEILRQCLIEFVSLHTHKIHYNNMYTHTHYTLHTCSANVYTHVAKLCILPLEKLFEKHLCICQ